MLWVANKLRTVVWCRFGVAVIIGIWGMFISALLLLVNFACQFSHTKREKEYIKRCVWEEGGVGWAARFARVFACVLMCALHSWKAHYSA